METKKSKRANLEKSKSIHFMLGMVVALSILFTGFEWGEHELNVDLSYRINPPDENIEFIDPTRQDPPPEPPKPEPIETPDIVSIVDDDVEVEPIQLAPSEDFPDVRQPVYVPPVENEEEEPADDYIYISVEVMPEFPGGNSALMKWIATHVEYPAMAAQTGIEGLVACTFTVNTDGSISDVEVLRPRDPLLDREAIRVLKSMPNWKPGMQQGKPVRVKFSVPVRFRLQK